MEPPFAVSWINEQKERGIVATRDIAEDEIIFSERPVVCAQYLYNQIYFPACSYCLKSLEKPSEMLKRLSENSSAQPFPDEPAQVPVFVCPFCIEENYCSEECRQHGWNSFHQVLCKAKLTPQNYAAYVSIQELWKSFNFPPETATITLVCRIYAMVMVNLFSGMTSFEQALSPFTEFKQQYMSKDSQVLTFLRDQFKGNIERLYQNIIQIFDDAFTRLPAEMASFDFFKFILCITSLNGQGIGTSALETYKQHCNMDILQYISSFDEQVEDASEEFTHAEGTGLYSLHSKLNHSCDPNAQILYLENSSTLSVKAVRPISRGDEVCIEYVCCDDLDLSERRETLEQFYLFKCTCPRCLAEDSQ